MPRRALAVLTALVIALHALALLGLPHWSGGTGRGTPERMAFHTRMVVPEAPPPPPPAEPAAAPAAPAAPAAKPAPPPRKRPAPVRQPRPPPAPSPAPTPAPAPAPPDEPQPMPASTADAAPAGDADAPAMAAAAPAPEEPVPSASIAAAAAAQAAAQAASAVASAPATPPEPAASQPDDLRSAGVDIRPPGGTAAAADTTPPPVRLPAPVRLTFDVSGQAKKFDYRASASLAWRHDGARYEARQEVKAFLIGSRSQTSTGLVTPTGLQPERFGDKARSEQAAHFDFGAGRATFSANTPPAAIAAGAQDRLSVFIQLGALLSAAPERYPDGTHITLTTVGARNADRWTFTIEGTDTLDLPIGPTPALRLQRLPRRDYDQKAELWLAPSLGFLPARIRITQSNGDYVDLRLAGRENP
ncbi:DUF3108 domain-containing protein [Acidovorax sp. NCPPB 4044]|uniref:DUF3108 domain-containing protein n=1 Tax=Acidovorax sp. NCPPB 4044 TaxID=2940490 RepID=UPI002302043A|nr:DUF3108 domain-containing protein [Acidovorax sp. NCPPB 4044]MDA8522699.1 DUF3108 domain-containing protein [Acidovorax sp. NCPPB 4044]